MTRPHGWVREEWASDEATRRLKAKVDFFIKTATLPGDGLPDFAPWRCPRCGEAGVGFDVAPPPPGDCDAAVVQQVMGA